MFTLQGACEVVSLVNVIQSSQFKFAFEQFGSKKWVTSTGIHQTKLLRFGDHFLYSCGLNDKIMFDNLYCTDINISFAAAHQRFGNVTVRRN